MNILFAAPWDQKFGGVTAVVGNLAKELLGKGHQAWFLYPGENEVLSEKTTRLNFQGYELRLRAPSVENASIKSRIGFALHLLGTLWQLYRLIKRHRIDIVNIHYPSDHFVYLALLHKICGFKLVVSVHGADLFPEGRLRNEYRWGLKCILRSADLVVAPSRSLLEDAVGVFPNLQHKGLFIHNGVSLEEFQFPSAPMVAKPKRYILCVAQLGVKKGIDVLIRAFASLADMDHDLELWLAGNGPLRSQLEAVAHDLKIFERVRFLGFRDRDDICRLMNQCHFFVLPSRAEPFGIVIVEAMACRKAVVASAVGGISEIIKHGVDGLLVSPDRPDELAAALRALLTDESLRQRLGESGYAKTSDKFQWHITADRYEEALIKLCDRNWRAVDKTSVRSGARTSSVGK